MREGRNSPSLSRYSSSGVGVPNRDQRVESKKIAPPEVKGYDKAYDLSYQLASELLRAISDLDSQCRKAGAECQTTGPQRRITFPFLARQHSIRLPEIDIVVSGSSEPVQLRDKLLILHYFNTSKGTPPTGKPVTFRELPAGPVYFPTYTKRAIKPIVDAFGKEPERMVAAAVRLGGRKGDLGDASAIIGVFPRVAITYVLWAGDEELPPQGNILYDANIPDYLPTEDITVLTESVTWRMVRS
jgi:hypothetical protein